MHHGELSRPWREYPHPAPDKRACRSSGGVCEVDSSNEVRRATSQKLRKYDARCCIIFTEGYRSGHNEAVLKTVCLTAQGFESLPLRQKPRFSGLFFFIWLSLGWILLVYIESLIVSR